MELRVDRVSILQKVTGTSINILYNLHAWININNCFQIINICTLFCFFFVNIM